MRFGKSRFRTAKIHDFYEHGRANIVCVNFHLGTAANERWTSGGTACSTPRCVPFISTGAPRDDQSFEAIPNWLRWGNNRQDGKDCAYSLIKFSEYQKSRQGSTLKSKSYEEYMVLVLANTMFHSGWFVCPFFLSGFCLPMKGILKLNSRKGRSNKFCRHIQEHKMQKAGQRIVLRNVSDKCQKSIADATAFAVILGIRPLGFTRRYEEVRGSAIPGRSIDTVYNTSQSLLVLAL